MESTGGETPITIPDGIEPLVGWRGWNVTHDADEPRLVGLTHPEVWNPGVVSAAECMVYRPVVEVTLHNVPPEDFAEAEAEIEKLVSSWNSRWNDPHEPPNEGCTCGLYAKLKQSEIESGQVWGRIEAWGKIVKGAYGFRAEYARVTGLLLTSRIVTGPNRWFNHDESVRELARIYEVPILDDPGLRSVHEIAGRSTELDELIERFRR